MEQLRLVQRARRRFVELGRVEQDIINPMLDRMADDLQGVATSAGPKDDDDDGQTATAAGDVN
jgi:hypothetical protein